MNKNVNAILFLGIFALAAAACMGSSKLSEVVGQVWLDEDNDGLKSDNEPEIAGIKVSLFKVTDGGTVEIDSTKTDGDGSYTFSVDDLEESELEVRVTAPDGAKFTLQKETGEFEIGSDVDSSGSSGKFSTRSDVEEEVVNAGFATEPEEVASTTETEPETKPPTETPPPTEPAAPTDTVAPSPTPTFIPPETPEVSLPDPIVPAQTVPDGLNDAVDCERTLEPTNQVLPFDVSKTGWLSEDGEVTLILEFEGEFQNMLEGVGPQDFFGMGWGFFDPEAEMYSNPDPTWLPNVAANKSFDVFYDPATGSFLGTQFIVENGAWIENPDIEYPVFNTGIIVTMTVPAAHIPPNASGFATMVYFDAEEGQLYCDWAGVDEPAFRDTLIDLLDSAESIDPPKVVDTFYVRVPGFDVESGVESPFFPPPVGGAYVVTNTVTSGLIHKEFVLMPDTMPISVTIGLTETNSISFSGPPPFVSVDGLLLEDGSFDASGSGVVAGFSDIDVNLTGTINEDALHAEYTMGGGLLPGGEDIVFDVSGVKLPDLPDLPLEPTLIYTDSINTFYNNFNTAFQDQNVELLFDQLHPEVINLYGEDNCQVYLDSVIGNTIFVDVAELGPPGPWVWERDGHSIPVEDAFTIQANVSVGGQTQEQEMHVAAVDDAIYWFTDCGEPLP